MSYRVVGTNDEGQHPLPAVAIQDLMTDLLYRDRRKGRFQGWFPNHAIPAHRRNERVPGPDRHREVEGTDDTDGTQGQPLLVHPMSGSLAGHGETVQLPREAHREV